MTQKTKEDLLEALSRLIDAAWNRDASAAFSIPVDEERDADCILKAAIEELHELRGRMEGLEK